MNQGIYISGIAHALIILWALFAGLFLRGGEPLSVQTMDVQVLSSEEFAALTAAPEPELAQPELPAQTPAELTQPTPPADEAPATPEPAPEAPPAPQPAPEISVPAPPPAEAAPDAPVSPEPPTPEAAVRIAPETAPEPEPNTEIAPDVVEQVTPDPQAEAAEPAEDTQATAPEAAADQIVTEAEEPSSAAPVRSLRPMARPNFTPPAAATEPEEPAPDQSAAIADALAQAQTETPTRASRPSGPPMSAGEKDALRVSVGKCWNTGALSSDALTVTVEVYVAMKPDGKPEAGSIKMVRYSGGSETAAKQAYEAARRAIIRCGARGFDLPREKYDHWREIEMVFNPTNMRVK